mgnify:FL=1
MVIFLLLKTNSYGIGSLKKLREGVSHFPEVMECYQVSGDHDFILKVVVSDVAQYNTFIEDKLSTVKHLTSVKSMFAITEGKFETAFCL